MTTSSGSTVYRGRASAGLPGSFALLSFIVLFGLVGVLIVRNIFATTAPPEILSGILNKPGSWCINDENSGTTLNNKVFSAQCNGSKAQQWVFKTVTTTTGYVENNALPFGHYCLEVLNGSTAPGGRVVLDACNGSSVQKWTRVNSQFQYAPSSSKGAAAVCLAIYGGYTGLQLRTNTCDNGYYSQHWILTTYQTPAPTPTPPPTPSSGSEHIISTLYAYPTLSSWQQVESAAPTVKYAIVNICAPDGSGSGCGRPADEINTAWIPTLQALQKAGITPLYYISTNYGGVSVATIESELNNMKTWYGNYGVVDPMFDTTATNNPSYYQTIYNYSVNNIGSSAVMFNPGTTVPESYMFGSKEIVQVYEGTALGFEGTSFPSWMKNYPASEFSATLSVGTSSTVGTDVTDAVNDHIGNFYEDDEAESPNYATLPSFWTAEVNDVANAK